MIRYISCYLGDAVSSILLAPAVTPWETTLPGVIGGAANNPSIRLIKYDRSTGVTKDVIQYYLNLTLANEQGYATWECEYTGTDYYNQPDMGTTSLNNIAQALLDNDTMFDKYYVANGVNYDPSEKCTEECRVIHYCAITEVDYEKYDQCYQGHVSGAQSVMSSGFFTLCIIGMAMRVVKIFN